jgi:hypothetical protein
MNCYIFLILVGDVRDDGETADLVDSLFIQKRPSMHQLADDIKPQWKR